MEGPVSSDHQTWASRANGGKTDSSGFALKARVRRVREKTAACARQRRMSQSKWAGLPDSVPLAGWREQVGGWGLAHGRICANPRKEFGPDSGLAQH